MGRSIYFLSFTIIRLGLMHYFIGRKGIGLGKRARSPSAAERLAKMAKMAEDMDHRDFRERARDDYNNRRAEGRLGVYIQKLFRLHGFNFVNCALAPAQLTCATLDEQMGKSASFFFLFFYNNAGTHR